MKSELRIKTSGSDPAFTIYFTLMFCFYTITYLQLAIQIALIGYVLFSRFKVSMTVVKRELFLLSWFGLLTLVSFLSTRWAYSVKEGTNTNLTLFRILVIAVVLFLYVNSYERAVAVLKSYIIGSVIMAALVLVTTPLSQYGQTGEEGFGTLIGQHRNTVGAVMVFTAFMSYILFKNGKFSLGRFYCAFSVFTLLCTGSRGAYLQFVIVVLIYVVFQNDLRKLVPYFLGILIAVPIVLVIIRYVPFLYETIWVRFESLFATISGADLDADTSAQGRQLYKVLARKMFESRPWLGYGVDGFYCVLRDIQFINGVYLPAKYSHCNYTELAACYGIVGIVIWYVPVLRNLIGAFLNRKKSNMMMGIFAMLVSMVILDYARIPWSAHITMYCYFCLFLLYFYSDKDTSKKLSTRVVF